MLGQKTGGRQPGTPNRAKPDLALVATAAPRRGGRAAAPDPNLTPRTAARAKDKQPAMRTVVLLPLASLVPNPGNPRTHTEADVDELVRAIRQFGWTMPIVVSGLDILAGHRRRAAGIKLKLEQVPCVDVKGWSEAKRNAYLIWDNKSAESGGWDKNLLAGMFSGLQESPFDVTLTGFSALEVDRVLGKLQPETIEPKVALRETAEATCPKCGHAFRV